MGNKIQSTQISACIRSSIALKKGEVLMQITAEYSEQSKLKIVSVAISIGQKRVLTPK